MIDVVGRVALLSLVLAVSSGLVAAWHRRPGRGVASRQAGVVLFTGPGCTLCGPVERALRARGVNLVVVDVTATEPTPAVRSLPTVVVTAEDGATLLRRSGRAALEDVAAIATAAATVHR